ncbi:unnamed protein product [Symbiodinium sp. KB8]|nr:unnamed protein product [Symbiodinium sp. KB8]
MIGVGLFKSIRTPGNILDGRGGTGQPSAGELSLQYPKIDKVKRYHAAARGRLPADKLWGFVAQLTDSNGRCQGVDRGSLDDASSMADKSELRNELVDAFADVASDAQIAGFHASPLADCTVKTRYGSEMTPKKEAQMLAEWSGRNHEERSQGFATQCKHALDKLGVLGVLTMMSPASEKSQAACNSAVEKAIRNAMGSSTHETGAPGLSDGLTVMGCGPASPKGTQAGLGGSPTSRTQGSRKGRETDSEEMSAMGLTVQRMETAKTAEHAPEMEPEEPEEPQEGEEELPVETGGEFDVDEEELLSDDHLKSIRKLMFILRLWSGNKAFKNGSSEDLEASKPLADAAEERETPVQQVFDVVARVKARSGAMLCSQCSFENLLETLQKVDKAAGAKIYKKIPLSRVREAFNEQIALQISLSSRYGLSAAEASKGMVFETFRTCMHRLFYRPLETEEEVKELLIQSKAAF